MSQLEGTRKLLGITDTNINIPRFTIKLATIVSTQTK